MNVYKHVNRDFTKVRKRKASTRTPFVVKQRKEMVTDLEKVLYDYVVDPAASQPSEETSGAFPFTERTFLSAFLELMTAGIHILPPLRTLFCVLHQSLPPCLHCSLSMKQYACKLKIVTGLP